MTLGARIQRLRKEAGLSQEALAEQLGVSRQAVSKWELDSTQPELDKLVGMARLFGVTTDELLTGIFSEQEEATATGRNEPVAQNAPAKWYLLGLLPAALGVYLLASGLLALIQYFNIMHIAGQFMQ